MEVVVLVTVSAIAVKGLPEKTCAPQAYYTEPMARNAAGSYGPVEWSKYSLRSSVSEAPHLNHCPKCQKHAVSRWYPLQYEHCRLIFYTPTTQSSSTSTRYLGSKASLNFSMTERCNTTLGLFILNKYQTLYCIMIRTDAQQYHHLMNLWLKSPDELSYPQILEAIVMWGISDKSIKLFLIIYFWLDALP